MATTVTMTKATQTLVCGHHEPSLPLLAPWLACLQGLVAACAMPFYSQTYHGTASALYLPTFSARRYAVDVHYWPARRPWKEPPVAAQ